MPLLQLDFFVNLLLFVHPHREQNVQKLTRLMSSVQWRVMTSSVVMVGDYLSQPYWQFAWHLMLFSCPLEFSHSFLMMMMMIVTMKQHTSQVIMFPLGRGDNVLSSKDSIFLSYSSPLGVIEMSSVQTSLSSFIYFELSIRQGGSIHQFNQLLQ